MVYVIIIIIIDDDVVVAIIIIIIILLYIITHNYLIVKELFKDKEKIVQNSFFTRGQLLNTYKEAAISASIMFTVFSIVQPFSSTTISAYFSYKTVLSS